MAADHLARFAQLPAELRIEIWEFTFCQPRVVPIRYNGTALSDAERAESAPTCDARLTHCTSPAVAPVALHVCRESRYLALRVFRPLFGTLGRPGVIYFNPVTDVLFFEGDRRDPGRGLANLRTVMALACPDDLAAVRHLALSAALVHRSWARLTEMHHHHHHHHQHHRRLRRFSQGPNTLLPDLVAYHRTRSFEGGLLSRRIANLIASFAHRMPRLEEFSIILPELEGQTRIGAHDRLILSYLRRVLGEGEGRNKLLPKLPVATVLWMDRSGPGGEPVLRRDTGTARKLVGASTWLAVEAEVARQQAADAATTAAVARTFEDMRRREELSESAFAPVA